MKQKALTLVEILVVIAIIGLLTALVFGISQSSLRAARETDVRANLRQLHVATSLYREATGGFPLNGVDPVIDAGYLTARQILKINGDPYPEGYGKKLHNCLQINPAQHWKFESSFESIFFYGMGRFTWIDMVQPKDENFGWYATRILGEKMQPVSSDCPSIPFLYEGKTLRVNGDGSVTSWNRVDRTRTGARASCYPAVFTSVSPSEICSY
jgi:prepilin-type N-terminal cleavage/methylation domain-containing protein